MSKTAITMNIEPSIVPSNLDMELDAIEIAPKKNDEMHDARTETRELAAALPKTQESLTVDERAERSAVNMGKRLRLAAVTSGLFASSHSEF